MTAAVLIVIALVAALAVAARMHITPNVDLEALRKRYARGLITREDYERLQRELRSAE